MYKLYFPLVCILYIRISKRPIRLRKQKLNVFFHVRLKPFSLLTYFGVGGGTCTGYRTSSRPGASWFRASSGSWHPNIVTFFVLGVKFQAPYRKPLFGNTDHVFELFSDIIVCGMAAVGKLSNDCSVFPFCVCPNRIELFSGSCAAARR